MPEPPNLELWLNARSQYYLFLPKILASYYGQQIAIARFTLCVSVGGKALGLKGHITQVHNQLLAPLQGEGIPHRAVQSEMFSATSSLTNLMLNIWLYEFLA